MQPLNNMLYLKEFKIFEDKHSFRIREYIEDVFLEMQDDGHDIEVIEDESIHRINEYPKNNKGNLLYGTNFIYPSEGEKRYGRLPNIGTVKDWKLGFIVKLGYKMKEYDSMFSPYEYTRLASPRGRSEKVRVRRYIDKYTREQDLNRNEIIKIVKKKVNLVKKRCPDEISLFGVRVSDEKISHGLLIEFAFIYNEYKD